MAVGIICEYNPFHKGHLYQMQRARELSDDDAVVCAMSGHFVQRGEVALLDKFTRARMALFEGADLILEIPTLYATATAEDFAFGAVSLLLRSGVVTSLSFGMEDPSDLPLLQRAADILADPDAHPSYQSSLQALLSQKLPYPSARQRALEAMLGASLPTEGNSILALAYLTALKRLHAELPLYPVRRTNPHDDASLPSALFLRHLAKKGEDLAPYLGERAAAYLPPPSEYLFPEAIYPLLCAELARLDPVSLSAYDQVGEGLENRILEAYWSSASYEELMEAVMTKRYPRSRIRRIFLNIALGITRELKEALSFTKGPSYLRVLGLRSRAESLLSEMKQKSTLPLIINPSRDLIREGHLDKTAKAAFEKELFFSRLHAQIRKSAGLLPHPDQELREGLLKDLR